MLRTDAVLCAICLAGCSTGPSRIVPPNIDPETASAAALELYDTDHDQAINKVEAVGCPGVKFQFKAYDQSGDGLITVDEFAERIRALRKHRVGLTRLQCEVQLNGRPLQDAVVLMEPESYLGSEIKAATGATNSRGIALMSISQEELPSSQQGLRAVHYGTYKVRITHPTLELPAKYNLATELGYETIIGSPTANFSLKAP
jgi:hypothetical protein